MKRRLLLRLLPVLVLLLLVVPSVFAAVRVDADGQVPFYARAPRNGIIHDGEWAVIVFYRPAECIPADFNLLDFFDFPGATGPGAFGCNPPTMDSIEVWENGPAIDFGPLTANFHGLGAVPVWFVSWPELEAAIADDMLTISELESLDSLMKGSAAYYHEVIHPSETSRGRSNIQITARGEVEGGAAFQVHVSLVDGASSTVNIDFK